MGVVELDQALGGAERVLLDSSTLLAFHSPHERVHPLADRLLRRIEDSRDSLRGYYSVVSAVELLVRPIRTSQERFTFMYSFLLEYPSLTVLPMDLTVAVQAANLRASSNIPLPVAVVVASGLLAGCEAIVTNDERWKKKLEPAFPRFRWIYLADYR